MSANATPRTVSLTARRATELTFEQALSLLGPDAPSWLGSPDDAAPDGMRRFAVDLRLGTGPGGREARIGKAALVDLGAVRTTGAELRVEISWRAANLAPLFPVFSGWLTVGGGAVSLEGRYAPPGGVIGLAADRALLHVAAERTAQWFLAELERAGGPPSSNPPAKPTIVENGGT
jgi:hypothetical protein